MPDGPFFSLIWTGGGKKGKSHDINFYRQSVWIMFWDNPCMIKDRITICLETLIIFYDNGFK